MKLPIFRNAFVRVYRDGNLQEVATPSFAWLLAVLLSLLPEQSLGYHDLTQDLTARELLFSSSHIEFRTMGQKVKLSSGALTQPPQSMVNEVLEFGMITTLLTFDRSPSFPRLMSSLPQSPLFFSLPEQSKIPIEDRLVW